MRINLIILLFLFGYFYVVGQPIQNFQLEVDEAKKKFAEAENDSLKLHYLTLIGRRFRFINIDSSKHYLWKALAAHKAIRVNPKKWALAYNVLTDIYKLEPNLDSARYYYEEAYQQFVDLENPYPFLAIASPYGEFLVRNNEPEKGLQLFQEAIDTAKIHEDYANLSFLYADLGDVFYRIQKDYPRAIHFYLKGLENGEQMMDTLNFNRISATIGLSLSNIYLYEMKLDSAIFYAERVVEYGRNGNFYQKVASAYNNLCETYLNKHQYQKAQSYNRLARELNKRVKDHHSIIQTAIHTQALNFYFKDYRACILNGNQVLKTYQGNLDHEMKAKVFKYLCSSYISIGSIPKAIDAQDSLLDHMKNTLNLKHSKLLATLYDEFQLKEQEAENKLLQSRQEAAEKRIWAQQVAAFGLSVALLFALALVFTLYRASKQRKKHNQELETTVANRTQELLEANRDLTQTNYELTTLTYIASHDIKEPIRNIGNFAELIHRKLPDNLKEKHEVYFQMIRGSTRQLYSLIEDLTQYITISKSDKLPIEKVDLNEILMGVKSTLFNLEEHNKVAVLGRKLPVIESNSSALYFILKNLLDNAIKYNESAQPRAEITYRENSECHQLMVSDNGIGISPEYQDKIFEMFKRLHNRSQYEGTGMGLSIVKLLVDKLNGKIEVESELQKGSRFLVSLPKEEVG